MKKTFLFITLLFMLNFSISANQPSQEEAKEAFILTFQTYFYCAFLMAYGQEFPGASLNVDQLTLDSFEISILDLDEPTLYQTITGDMIAEENSEAGTFSMSVDLLLTGGPVKTLRWSMIDADFESDVIEVDVIADGVHYHLVEDTDS